MLIVSRSYTVYLLDYTDYDALKFNFRTQGYYDPGCGTRKTGRSPCC